MAPRAPITRVLWILGAVGLASALVCVLVFTVLTIRTRIPYWGEAEVVFEAGRVRAGRPLFVDPFVGAFEDGAPPSRYYVTYPPLVSYLISIFPASIALVTGRVIASAAWFGVLAWIAIRARDACRATAVACAAFVAGIWLLANFATVGRPDAIACALAGVGLARSIRLGRVDALSACLLALAPWVKPTLLGLPAGALLVDAASRRSPKSIAIATAAATLVGAALWISSHGAILEHVIRSNAQPMTLEIWTERVGNRLPFFAPLFLLAFSHGVLARRDPGVRIGLGALGVGLAWMLFAIAKTGSAANYWMEPCIAAVALVAHAPGPFSFGKSGLIHAAAAFATIVYADVASVRSSLERIGEYRREAVLVASVRARCGAAPTDIVASDEQGIELALDGRILAPGYQTAWLVAGGKFPAALWIQDLASANVRCFVEHAHTLMVAPEVARAVEAEFEPVATIGDYRISSRRTR